MKKVFDFDYKKNTNHPDSDEKNLTQDGWNQWPFVDGGGQFQNQLEKYFEHCTGVALRLLEVFHNKSWKPVAPIPGTMVVNIGDTVKVWSNDLYHAALHRVVASSGKDRYSAPYFFNSGVYRKL